MRKLAKEEFIRQKLNNYTRKLDKLISKIISYVVL
jgi:hypothetical protein